MRKALGRGLDALIPGAGRAAPSAPAIELTSGRELQLPIAKIKRNPRQPRHEFDEATLAELESSIRRCGVIQPLVVRPLESGDFELVAGERRLRAAERAGMATVPVITRAVSDQESLELALIENLQRDDLHALEEAEAYQRLIDDFGHTQDEVATRVGKSRPAVANTLRLLRLPAAVKDEVARGRLSAGHARALLALDDAPAQLRAVRQIVARGLSVRETEELAAARRPAPRRAAATKPQDPNWQAIERDLSAALGTRVRLRPRGRGGRIEIEYYSAAELDGLVARLRE